MKTTRLAALVAVVGLAAAAVWAVTAVLDQIQRPVEFSRADLPGQVAVTLTQLGPHVVFHESPAGTDPGALPHFSTVEVLDPLGATLAVRPYDGDLRYDRGGAVGTAVAVFDAQRTGTYLASLTGDAPVDGALAVGDDLAPGVGRALLLPALTALAALVLAGALALSPTRARPTDRTP